jgi:hypothetical protein
MIRWQVSGDEYTISNIHALSGIRTHCLNVQAIKSYASVREATGTGTEFLSLQIDNNLKWKTHSIHYA